MTTSSAVRLCSSAQVPLFARVEDGFMHALTQKMEPVNASKHEILIHRRDCRRNRVQQSTAHAAHGRGVRTRGS